MAIKPINRRELLKSASTICAASALGSLPFAGCKHSEKIESKTESQNAKPAATCQSTVGAACPSSNSCQVSSDFTIVLHGLFFIELWRPFDSQYAVDEKVRIIAPDCSKLKHVQHVYKAGSWGKRFADIKQRNYEPHWTEPSNNPMTTDRNLPEVPGASTIQDAYGYFSLALPYPKSIRALRVIDGTLISKGRRVSAGFPLVTALTYGADRPSNRLIDVPDGCWDAETNFHIFAEPDCLMNCDQMNTHGIETQAAAKDCFPSYPVPATIINCDQPPDPVGFDSCPPCLGAPGVHCEEEISLWEMKGAPHCPNFEKIKPFAVHMPTCASLIVSP